MEIFSQIPTELTATVVILVLWEVVWKAIAMWKSARKNQLAWFVCIAIFNTVGILPIVYLLLNRQKPNCCDTDKSAGATYSTPEQK